MYLKAARINAMKWRLGIFWGIALLCGCNPPSSREAIERYASGDVKGALEDLQKGAGRKDLQATYFLALIYDYGDGVERDSAKANNLYMNAATLGLPRAQAIMYVLQLADKKHRKVENIIPALAALADQDPIGSLRWYCEGLHNLATEDDGYDVSEQFTTCLEKLKDVDEASAYRLMASAYFGGLSYPKDDVKGVEMAKKAAAAGDLRAQPLLANAYYNGKGTQRDLVRAYAHAQTAISIGNQVMSKSRKEEMQSIKERTEKRFSSAQLAEAKSLAGKIQSQSQQAYQQWREKYLFAWAIGGSEPVAK